MKVNFCQYGVLLIGLFLSLHFDLVAQDNLPTQISLVSYAPRATEQKPEGCVAWAIANILTISRAIASKSQDRPQIDSLRYSAAFLYARLCRNPDICRGEVDACRALNFIQDTGCCYERTFPDTSSCAALKNGDKAFEEAKRLRIKRWQQLFSDAADDSTKIKKLTQSLADSSPVLVILDNKVMTESFKNLKNRYLWQPSAKEKLAQQEKGHALVAVGYDNTDSTIILLNSWGEDWGDKGFVKMRYRDFLRYSVNAYVLTTPCFNLPEFQGTIQAKTGNLPEKIRYDTAHHAYKLTQTQANDWFFYANWTGKGYYFLLTDNDYFKARFSTASNIPIPQNEVFPSGKSLCLLITAEPIDDFNTYFDIYKTAKGSLYERVQTAFKPILMPSESIIYDPMTLQFSLKPYSDTSLAVPIFISF